VTLAPQLQPGSPFSSNPRAPSYAHSPERDASSREPSQLGSTPARKRPSNARTFDRAQHSVRNRRGSAEYVTNRVNYNGKGRERAITRHSLS
jgi:hypothetical protein